VFWLAWAFFLEQGYYGRDTEDPGSSDCFAGHRDNAGLFHEQSDVGVTQFSSVRDTAPRCCRLDHSVLRGWCRPRYSYHLVDHLQNFSFPPESPEAFGEG